MIKVISYWFSEATNENQIGQFLLPRLAPAALSTTCAGVHISPDADILFRPTARILLRFTGPGSKTAPFLSSWTFILCPCSLILVLGMQTSPSAAFSGSALALVLGIYTSLSGALNGSNLARDVPWELNLEDLVLFAASTRQFNGVHRSTFPSHGSASFSVSLLGFWSFEASDMEEFYNWFNNNAEVLSQYGKYIIT